MLKNHVLYRSIKSNLWKICIYLVLTCIFLRRELEILDRQLENEKKSNHNELDRWTINVLTCDRPKSLLRLLKSVESAEYPANFLGKLNIWVDIRHGAVSHDLKTGIVAQNFNWTHGQKEVIFHKKHQGVIGQWLLSWYPSSLDEKALFLEDDLELSRHYFKWLAAAHKTFGNRPYVAGFTLMKGVVRANQTVTKSNLVIPDTVPNYFYHLVGSWGFSPRTAAYKKLIDWYKTVANDPDFHPYIKDNIMTTWYKKVELLGKTETIWTIWHGKFSEIHNLFTLYPNLPNSLTLSCNWREIGEHFPEAKSKDFNLLTTWNDSYAEFDEQKIIYLDWNGEEIR